MDPFGDEYFPPNGWNCRCTVVQVLKEKYPATDRYKQRCAEGCWDGHPFEAAGKLIFPKGAVRNGLKHCASKKVTEYAVLCFPNGGFDVDTFNEGLKMFNGLKYKMDGQWMQFKKIICIQNQTIVYELEP